MNLKCWLMFTVTKIPTWTKSTLILILWLSFSLLIKYIKLFFWLPDFPVNDANYLTHEHWPRRSTYILKYITEKQNNNIKVERWPLPFISGTKAGNCLFLLSVCLCWWEPQQNESICTVYAQGAQIGGRWRGHQGYLCWDRQILYVQNRPRPLHQCKYSIAACHLVITSEQKKVGPFKYRSSFSSPSLHS